MPAGRRRRQPEPATGSRGSKQADAGSRGPKPPVDQPIILPVRVRPGSSRPRVGGRFDGPHGPALVIAVAAPAVDGRATDAARRALARALGVRPTAVVLRAGAASRDKLVRIDEPSPGLADRLRELRDATGASG